MKRKGKHVIVHAEAVALVCLVSLCGGCVSRSAPRVLVRGDVSREFPAAGWAAAPAGGQQPAVEWAEDGTAPGGHGVLIRSGTWESLLFPVKPFVYYRLTFRSRAEAGGYWAAVFYDKRGEPMIADHYSSVDQSASWRSNDCFFRAKANATHTRIRFQPLNGKPMIVADVSVTDDPTGDVMRWADSQYASIPPVNGTPPADRWQFIPKAVQKLRKGGTLRIVFLGDSIANDTGNSPFDVLLGRMYPKASVQVVTSVRGGTGCQWYKDENRVQEFVIDCKPDLLIIAGISHGYDTESMRAVIRQVRARINPEIMIMTGAVCPDASCKDGYVKYSKLPEDTARANLDSFPARVRSLAAEEKVELFDMRTAWDSYIASCGKPQEWFMRDPVHANCRGRQVLARIIEQYFAPKH